MRKIITSSNTIFIPKVKSQVRYGNSGDGQLTTITGLLPILNGVTCYLYEQDKYPSFVDCFPNSALFNPSGDCWNQNIMTYRYGFKKQHDVIGDGTFMDNKIIHDVISYCDSATQPFCAVALTVSSHTPFSHGKNHPRHLIPGMPQIMSDYLNCLQYTDSCVGFLIDSIRESELSGNTTIVITGDHTIFRSRISELDEYASNNGIPMQTAKTFTPLIIYSPLINCNVTIDDLCYQMDIYPTILNLLGCGDYYWKGLGVNLLVPNASKNRSISEEDAFKISELIIRSNFFDTVSK